MAAFPGYVKLGWRDMEESPEPVVARAEMERGIPKQRRIASDARVELPVVMHFESKADMASFRTWFYTTINGGADFFDLVHPRTLVTIQARFVGGQLGALKYLNPALTKATRPATLEYWESAWS